MSLIIGYDDNLRVRFIGGSTKAKNLRHDITELGTFIRSDA